MVYVAWATLLAGLVFGRRNDLTLATATLFGGIILCFQPELDGTADHHTGAVLKSPGSCFMWR